MREAKAVLELLFWLCIGPVAITVLLLLMPVRTECHCWDNGTVKTAIPCSRETWAECREACRDGRA